MKVFRTYTDRPVTYWLIGALLLWLISPVSLLDILILPRWHAPNWHCDSLGIPIEYTKAALIPWAALALAFSALLAIPAARRRRGGISIFDLRLGKSPWNWIVTPPVIAIVALISVDFVQHFWNAIVPHSRANDCGGRSELVELVMRGPLFQYTPLLRIGIGLWLLHLRALALSAHTAPPTGKS